GMLQGQRDLATVGRMLLSELVPLVNAHQGVIYQMAGDDRPRLRMLASYGNTAHGGDPPELGLGEGFVGPCALAKRRILVTHGPPDGVPISAAMFQALPRSIVVFPVIFEGEIRAVMALASLEEFGAAHLTFLDQLTASVGIVFNSIEATMQTEGLLKQSQQLAGGLQTRQK